MSFHNILVVRTDRIGDVVLTVPAIRALKKEFPAARVSVLVSPVTAPLLQGLSFIDEVIVEDRVSGLRGFWRTLLMLRRHRFDLSVIYHTKKRINILCALAGIPVRLGYRNDKCGFLLTHPVKDERPLGIKHESEYCLDLLLGIGVDPGSIDLEIAVDPVAERWADSFFPGISQGKPVVAIHPDSSCVTRHWPVSSFAALLKKISEGLNVTPVIIGASSTVQIAKEIITLAGVPAVDLSGKLSMAQLASFLRRTAVLVSNDSGPAHVAAAVDTPVVCLFLRIQPGINPTRWRPLGRKSVTLFNRSGEEIIINADSQVISGRFDSITPDDVLAEVKKVLP